jgi:hypothetical protein
VSALVRRGDLAAAKPGGRRQGRVERSKSEDCIERLYSETQRWVAEHRGGNDSDGTLDVPELNRLGPSVVAGRDN